MNKVLMLIIISIVLLSCTKMEDETNNGTTANMQNYVSDATSNSLVRLEAISGETERNSTIRYVLVHSSEDWYAIGNEKSNNIFGLLDNQNQYIWKRTLEFSPRKISSYEHEGSNYFLVAGGRDYDGDDSFEEGRVALYNENGDKLDEISILIADYSIWLNSISVVSTSTTSTEFKAVGGAIQDEVYYPYLLSGEVDLSSNKIKVNFDDSSESRVFANSKDKFFSDIATDESSTFIAYNYLRNDTYFGYGILKEENSLVKWDKIVESNSEDAYTIPSDGMRLVGDNIIIGGSKKIEKPENNEDLKDWYITKVYSLQKSNGSKNWSTDINKSYRGDFLTGIYAYDDMVYVLGRTANWQETFPDPDINFGYGYLSTLDATTGNELNFHSFGNKLYRQGFNTLSLQGNQLNLFGFTNFKNDVEDGGYYDRWMIELDESEL